MTAEKLALSSPTEVIDPLPFTYKLTTKEYDLRHKFRGNPPAGSGEENV